MTGYYQSGRDSFGLPTSLSEAGILVPASPLSEHPVSPLLWVKDGTGSRKGEIRGLKFSALFLSQQMGCRNRPSTGATEFSPANNQQTPVLVRPHNSLQSCERDTPLCLPGWQDERVFSRFYPGTGTLPLSSHHAWLPVPCSVMHTRLCTAHDHSQHGARCIAGA